MLGERAKPSLVGSRGKARQTGSVLVAESETGLARRKHVPYNEEV